MLERIKEERLLARVTDKTKYTLLTTVIGEYENEAKKNPNRDILDTITMFIKNIDKILIIADCKQLEHEKGILGKYLPNKLTSAEITNLVKVIISGGATSKGQIMKSFKLYHKYRYDNKELMDIIKEIL